MVCQFHYPTTLNFSFGCVLLACSHYCLKKSPLSICFCLVLLCFGHFDVLRLAVAAQVAMFIVRCIFGQVHSDIDSHGSFFHRISVTECTHVVHILYTSNFKLEM